MIIFSIKRIIILTVFLLAALSFKAQQADFYWEPKFSVSKTINSMWRMQGAVVLRQLVDNDPVILQKMESAISFDRSLFNASKIGGGYLFGGDDLFRPEIENEHRFMQQYAFYINFLKYRLANRIRTEQRIYSDGYKNRFRYRVSIDFPLNGDRLNVKEAYFLASNELLMNATEQNQDFENRIGLGIGWKLEKINKIQIQLQHRYTKIGLPLESHAVFLASAFYFKL
jgi:hypothetical protein